MMYQYITLSLRIARPIYLSLTPYLFIVHFEKPENQ